MSFLFTLVKHISYPFIQLALMLNNNELSSEVKDSLHKSYIRKEKYNPATTTPMYVTLRVPPLDSETGWSILKIPHTGDKASLDRCG